MIRNRLFAFLTCALCSCLSINSNEMKGFDDTNIFTLNWPGTENLLVRNFVNNYLQLNDNVVIPRTYRPIVNI